MAGRVAKTIKRKEDKDSLHKYKFLIQKNTTEDEQEFKTNSVSPPTQPKKGENLRPSNFSKPCRNTGMAPSPAHHQACLFPFVH